MSAIDRGFLGAGIIVAVMVIVSLLPIPDSVVTAMIAGAVLSLLFGLAEIVWQLFKDGRWVARWISRKVHPPKS